MDILKRILGFFLIAIIIVSINNYVSKTQLLVELLDLNADEINFAFVINEKTNQVNLIDDADDLIKLQEILKEINVKRIRDALKGHGYSLSISGDYGHISSDYRKITIDISDTGIIDLQGHSKKKYKIVEAGLLEDLIVLLGRE